jgi:tripeptide aminopeptidase
MKQFDLQKILLEELNNLGKKNAELDDNCYLMATIPSNIPSDHPAYGKVPVLGFVAHLILLLMLAVQMLILKL